jgi:hypothetical protein
MKRREILSGTAFAFGVLTGTPRDSFAQDKHSDDDLIDINNCKFLLGTVISRINSRLTESIMIGKNVQKKERRLAKIQLAAMDCQQLCTAACDILSRTGPMSKSALRVCADVCRDFAALCRDLDPPDSVIEECAEACAHCERTCLRRLTS